MATSQITCCTCNTGNIQVSKLYFPPLLAITNFFPKIMALSNGSFKAGDVVPDPLLLPHMPAVAVTILSLPVGTEACCAASSVPTARDWDTSLSIWGEKCLACWKWRGLLQIAAG